MARPANITEVMGDFPGLVNNVDEHDTPAGGAVELVNLCARVVGELRSRRGLQALSFEATTITGLTTTG